MFIVKSKATDNEYTVFSVKGNDFLVFANGEFSYQNMDKFYVVCSQHDPCDPTISSYYGTAPITNTKSNLFKCSNNTLVETII